MTTTPSPEPLPERSLNAAERAVVLARTASERDVMEAFLDYLRSAVVGRVAGLSEEDVRRRLVPSKTTPAALLRHLAAVERNWFQHHLAGLPRDEGDITAEGEDLTWEPAEDDTVASLTAAYERECERSRATAARFDLDRVVPHAELGEVSLRWIYAHMIEETGRHVGHAEILREQIDGSTST
ncbi:hypothetical protein HDA32_004553 [Spinactinospora alkalitolerans]|uniref:Mini-circle protein n=1 Tax=Spinactinospora alkalitolerans TaxID=687207 RepID=A0A852U3D4_9ACTN|nr:DinB family protein [Spinactinospora alkalitolerans]NYE49433.1 hypothetical protein [Spinactinospora alkalitolerans]